jgi:hypothetical protein
MMTIADRLPALRPMLSAALFRFINPLTPPNKSPVEKWSHKKKIKAIINNLNMVNTSL